MFIALPDFRDMLPWSHRRFPPCTRRSSPGASGRTSSGPGTSVVLFVRAASLMPSFSTLALWDDPHHDLRIPTKIIYYMTVQFYLHFQFNGWFTFTNGQTCPFRAARSGTFWALEKLLRKAEAEIGSGKQKMAALSRPVSTSHFDFRLVPPYCPSSGCSWFRLFHLLP